MEQSQEVLRARRTPQRTFNQAPSRPQARVRYKPASLGSLWAGEFFMGWYFLTVLEYVCRQMFTCFRHAYSVGVLFEACCYICRGCTLNFDLGVFRPGDEAQEGHPHL